MQEDEVHEHDYLYKIVMVGQSAVGKTHLMARYIRGTLPNNLAYTIGVQFATRTVPLLSGGVVKAQIWDTAGQERYHAITCAHYRRAVGALLVYDVTNEKSFVSVKDWMEELREHADPNLVIMLVGNKVDLVDRRKVPTEVAAKFAKQHNLMFCEASATTAFHVKEAFEDLLQEIYNVKTQAVVGRGYRESDPQPDIQLARKHPIFSLDFCI